MRNRKVVLLLVVLLVCIVICILLANTWNNDKLVKNSSDNAITRYEWLVMLCDQFGVEPDEKNEPYFHDVTKEDVHYGYVQSAVQWEMIEGGGTFDGEKPASGRFIALTAMKAIGEYKVKIYLGALTKIKDKDYLQIADDEAIITKEQWKDNFTKNECETILEQFGRLFTETMWGESVSEVVYSDKVAEVRDWDIVSYVGDNQIEINKEIAKDLSKDMIIVYQQKNSDLKVARRITDINKGLLTLDEPEISEVIDSLMVSDMTTVNVDDILQYNNVTEPISANASYRTLLADNQASVREVGNLVNSKGFSISIDYESGSSEAATATITDNDTNVSYVFPVDFGQMDKEMDTDIHATVEFDKIKIGTQLIYSREDGVQYLDLQTDANMKMSGEMQLEGEQKIKIFETVAPLGGCVVGVNLEVYLVLNQSGNISLQVDIPMQSKVYYEKDKGFRTYNYPDNEPDASITVNCEAKLLDRLEAIVVILGVCNVMDAEFDVGTVATAEMKIREDDSLQCMDIDIAFPVVTLQVCGDDDKETFLGELGLSAEWEMVTAEEAFLKESLHYELTPEGSGFVEECTYKQNAQEEAILTDNETSQNTSVNSNTYQTKYADVNMIPAAKMRFEYPDNWTVVSEVVNGEHYVGEEVILQNERGVTITFIQLETTVTNYSRIMGRVKIEKVADSSFIPGWVSGTDHSELGSFMVAKIKDTGYLFMDTDTDFHDEDGSTYYAVVPETYVGDEVSTRPCADYLKAYDCMFFEYTGTYAFFAEAPDGKFSSQEEKEVIEILSSFYHYQEVYE
ncbi:MAG: hypothetical protein E7264_06155 [Lachnospiraceae bacterium]|nr:hypothetical protein [Lachnospiraceae bacterium]